MRGKRRIRTRTALLVVIPANLSALAATGAVLANSQPGDAVPAFAALLGVAATMAITLVALVNLRRWPHAATRRAKAPAPSHVRAKAAESRSTARPLVASPQAVQATQVGDPDEYVDSLLADLLS